MITLSRYLPAAYLVAYGPIGVPLLMWPATSFHIHAVPYYLLLIRRRYGGIGVFTSAILTPHALSSIAAPAGDLLWHGALLSCSVTLIARHMMADCWNGLGWRRGGSRGGSRARALRCTSRKPPLRTSAWAPTSSQPPRACEHARVLPGGARPTTRRRSLYCTRVSPV